MNNILQGVSIFLIGMMGTGKTTVGKVLAQQLGYRFLDSDALIEQITKQNVSEIFAKEGEQAFRDLETQVIAELSTYTKSVVATGGGVVLRSQNWSYLHHGLIVWLDAPVNLLEQRLAEDTSRPLLQASDLKQKLSSLSQQRRTLYEQADLCLKILPVQTPEDIAAEAIAKIPTILKSKPVS
jgi:shikimate kinase